MDQILEMFSSAAFGGITGLIGVLGGKIVDYFTTKQKNEHELKMRDKDLEITKVEADKELTIAKDTNAANRWVAEQQADANIQTASYDADKATYITHDVIEHAPTWAQGVIVFLLGLVDFFRGTIRPGLTLYLCVLTTFIYVQMKNLVASASAPVFTPEEAVKIIFLIVNAVIYLTTVCVTWWFGSRPQTKR